jgi:hypothetical protein
MKYLCTVLCGKKNNPKEEKQRLVSHSSQTPGIQQTSSNQETDSVAVIVGSEFSKRNKFLPMQPTNSKIFITENHPFKFSSPNSNDQDKKTWIVHTWPQKQEENG